MEQEPIVPAEEVVRNQSLVEKLLSTYVMYRELMYKLQSAVARNRQQLSETIPFNPFNHEQTK